MSATSAFAQSTGTLSGRVLNTTTGKYLQSVSVVLQGTERTAYSDITGDFSFRGVPVGTYTLSASYLGLGVVEQQVTVSSGQVTNTTIEFSEDLLELEAFEAQGSLTGTERAINQQRAASGVMMVISDEQFGQMNDGNIGLAIQKMPGLSVDTDGFSEVPRYVNIRGVDIQYNNVQMDGNRLPSSGTGAPGRIGSGGAYGDTANGVALDDIPADAVSNVEVVKSPLPEHDGDSLGGIVNLVTRSAFERDGRVIAYKTCLSYSELRGSYSPYGSLTWSDVFGENSNFGVSVSLGYYKGDEGFDNTDYDWIPMFHRFDFGDNQDLVNSYLSDQLAAAEEAEGQEVLFFHEDTEFNNFNIERDRYSFAASFDWRVDDRTELYFKPVYTKEERTHDDIRHHLILDNDHGNSADPYEQYVSPFAASDARYSAGNYFLVDEDALDGGEIAAGDTVAAVGGGTVVFDPGALIRQGDAPDQISTILSINEDGATTSWNPDGSSRGRTGYEGEWQDQDIEFYSLNIGGKTEFDFGALSYDAFFSRSKKRVEESDTEFRRSGFQYTYDRSRDNFEILWNNLTDADRQAIPTPGTEDEFFLGFFELNDRENEETYIGLSSDLEIDFPDSLPFAGQFKTGFKLQFEERELDWDERQYRATSAFPFTDFLRDNPYDTILDNENFRIPYTPDVLAMRRNANNEDYFTFRDPQSLEDSFEQDYEASRDTYAAYVQAKFEVGKLEIIGGARVEHVEFESSQFVRPEGDFDYITEMGRGTSADFANESSIQWINNDTGVIQTLGRDATSSNSTEFLPSVHFKYEFVDGLIGRASWGKTYGRPNFSDLVGITDIDDTDDPIGVSRGNPGLPNLTSENFDLSLEYYTKSGGYFAVGFFYKELENFSYEAVQTGQASDFGLDTSLGLDPDADVEVSTAEASLGATNFGFEFSAQQDLWFIPEEWGRFSVNANATLTDSDANYPGRIEKLPTRGASNTLYYVGLNYSIWKIDAAVSYRFRSQYIEGLAFVDQQESSSEGEFAFVGDDQFDDSGEVDASIQFRLNENFIFYVNGTNLLNEQRFSVQGYRTYGDDAYWNERRINFGIKGEF
ncbi:MAG: TonB-dependent receptor [Opitutales bacterium]|nr:TonB-dependent receptor [Opitutales bacterium]